MRSKAATPAELAIAYRMWNEGATVVEIGAAVGRNGRWVYTQGTQRKWGRRRPRKGSAGHKYANIMQDARKEGEQRERGLYGDLADVVNFLRRRGWIITRDCARIIVGNKAMEPDAIRALAERERRMAGSHA